MRKLLRGIECVSAVFFRNASRSVEQLQNRLPCFVELIDSIGCGAFGTPRKRNYIRLVTTDLTMHHSALPTNLDPSYRWRGRFIVALSAHRASSIAKSLLLLESVTYEQQRAQVPSRIAAVAAAL